MNTSVECIYCILRKADSMFCKYVDDERKRFNFIKKVLKELGSYDDSATAPFLTSKVMKILEEEIGVEDLFLKEKKEYDKKMLSIEQDIWDSIDNSDDKLLAGLKYAMVGNFIDFGAMDEVDDNILAEIIDTALEQQIDTQLYKEFRREILKAEKLCYIVDNAGEVIFDKLFIKAIKELNEGIEIDIVVRGYPILNDVTMEDALEVGLDCYGNIIPNGTNIPGTDIKRVNKETIRSMDESDLIIAKGQGNFETLIGCGKNIYYIFLCKCDIFVERFGIKKFEGVFMKEQS
ncbi:MAG TPA: DUF89 family protein [Clostridiales bacterium]|nr:DUF89 family protein [Clostridiales bacterium]